MGVLNNIDGLLFRVSVANLWNDIKKWDVYGVSIMRVSAYL